MREIIGMLDENLNYLAHQMFEDYIEVVVESSRKEAACPYCGKTSSRVHSTYERSFQDLPIQGKKVYVSIINRKYFCDNRDCSNKTFAESFDFLRPKSKKSERLTSEIMKLSTEVSSVTAARLLKDGGVDVSKSTICDMLKKNDKSIGQGKRRENMHR
jgi:transposase